MYTQAINLKIYRGIQKLKKKVIKIQQHNNKNNENIHIVEQ